MRSLAEQAVDSINEVFGRHTACRAAHARGVVCRGVFTALPVAAALTRAPHMQGEPVEVTVRFSNASGDPNARDFANPCGLAIKFHLADGSATDIVAVTLKRFFAPDPATFIRINHALKRDSKTGAPGRRLRRLLPFLATHRRLIRPLIEAGAVKPAASYATCRYNALHAYGWLDAGRQRRFVRYSWLPDAGEEQISKKEAKKRDRNYLERELIARLAEDAVSFRLAVQIAEDGDPIDDSTALWPGSRRTVAVGELRVLELAEEHEPERNGNPLVFDPMRVTEGIEPSSDPILRFRPSAYAVSVDRRRSPLPPARWDRAGRAGALTVITPIPLWWKLWLASHWWFVNFRTRRKDPILPVRKLILLSFISFAHWSRFIVPAEKRWPIRRRQRYILFEVNFDGDSRQYIQSFSYVVPCGVRALWMGAHGVPAPRPFTPFYRHIEEKRAPILHYYCAYPEASTTIIASALELKRCFDLFRERARDLAPHQFEAEWRRFLTEVQTLL